jgi:transposase-like protein
MMKEPLTLQQAVIYFSEPDRAFQYALDLRFPGGKVSCPRCGSERHSFMKTRRVWECYGCKKQFSLKVGTVMEDSALGLDKWMMTAWMIANCKNGVSSYEIAKATGVTQKSAWFMLHRLREAMRGGSMMQKIGGANSAPVEVDEAFIGPKPDRMHRKRRLRLKTAEFAGSKTVVMGMLDRETRQVLAKVVPNVKRETLQNAILDNIERWSDVYTDNYSGYDGLLAQDFIHQIVNHVKEYVRGEVHTQGIENFWSLLKRGLRGTYVAVEPYHLDRYVSDQVFRFNNRATKDNLLNDADRFALLMSQVGGKRLTYAELTGKTGPTSHHAAAGTGQEN